MQTLLYRGLPYLQKDEALKPKSIELNYRRSIYKKRIDKVSTQEPRSYVYRGIEYKKD